MRSIRGVVVPRRIAKAGRLGLPQELGRAMLGEGPWDVLWTLSPRASRCAMLRAVTDAVSPRPPYWVRRLSPVWQLHVPPPVLETLQVGVGDLVYVGAGSDGRSLRVSAAESLRLVVDGPAVRSGPGRGQDGRVMRDGVGVEAQ